MVSSKDTLNIGELFEPVIYFHKASTNGSLRIDTGSPGSMRLGTLAQAHLHRSMHLNYSAQP
jgi:hypothetical protein